MSKQARFNLFLAIVYLVAAAGFFYGLFAFCNELGSTISKPEAFQNVERTYPLISAVWLPTLLLFYLFYYSHRKSLRVRSISLIAFGIAMMVLSFIPIIYVFVLVLNGTYSSVMVGYPNFSYPLGTLILHLVYMFVGLALYLRGLYEKTEKHVLLPTREDSKTWKKGCFGTFGTLYVLFSLPLVGSALLSPMYIDTSGNHVAFVISLTLALFLPYFLFVYYLALDSFPALKSGKGRIIGLISIGGLSLFIMLFFLICLLTDPRGIVETTQPYFPLDYMASIALGPVLLFLLPLGGLAYIIYKSIFPLKKE